MLEDYREISKISSQERHGDLLDQLAEFVCFVHGANFKGINNVRWKKFDQKPQREHKVADLGSLPPRKEVDLYHAKRANLTAYMIYVKKLGTANF